MALIGNGKAGGAAGGTTVAINMTGATLFVANVGQYDGGTITAPTDSQGNTWIGLTGQDATTEPYSRLYYVSNPSVNAAQTFSISNSNIFGTICVAGFSGFDVFDVENGAINSASPTIQPGSVTPSQSNELIITGVSSNPTNDTYTINSGFTITDSQLHTPGATEGSALAYLVQGAAAAINPTWTSSTLQANFNAATIAAFKAVAAATVVAGWQRGVDDFPPKPSIRFHPASAVALTPSTLPPIISGMAWRQPIDELPPRRLGKSDPPPFGRAIAQAPVPQGWDFINAIDDQPKKRFFSDAPAIALTPATLPPVIAGIAWFEPPDVYEPKRWFLQDAPGYGRPAISQLIGVPWANWLDILPKAPPKQQPSAALALTPATLPPQISGMAWFTTTDVYQPRRWFINEPSHVPYAPDTVTWSFQSSDTVFLPDPPINYPPAFGTTPPVAPSVTISGMAWFEPPDRNRPAIKINGESQPAIALTPATLPPVISGMAWRQPLDELPLRPRIDRPHPGPALTVTPTDLLSSLIGVPWSHRVDEKPVSRPVSHNTASAIALTPATLPPVISGMAWFEPLDIYQPRRWYLQDAPAFGRAITGVAISGMAWFEPPDRNRPATKINIESQPAIVLTPATLPPQISGMAWFIRPDIAPPKKPPIPMDWPTAWAPYVVTVTSSFVRRPLQRWARRQVPPIGVKPVWSYWKGRSS